MSSQEKTPLKSYVTLSPSASSICILCGIDINIKYPNDSSKKIRLWSIDGSKTTACIEFESYMNTRVRKNKDFSIICKNCNERVKCSNTNRKKETRLFEGSKELAETYKRIKFKRGAKSQDVPGQSSKRKLSFSKHGTNAKKLEHEQVEVVITTENRTSKTICVREELGSLVKSAATGDFENTIIALENGFPDESNEWVQRYCSKQINKEATGICKRTHKSTFKSYEIEDLKRISYEDQHIELQQKAPLFLTALKAFSLKASNTENKIKSSESLIPSLMNATSTLLFMRNKHVSRNPSAISMALRNGKCSKACIDRMNSLHLSSSYHTLLGKQMELGSHYRKTIEQWRDKLCSEAHSIVDKIDSLSCDISQDIQLTFCSEEFVQADNNGFESFFSPPAFVKDRETDSIDSIDLDDEDDDAIDLEDEEEQMRCLSQSFLDFRVADDDCPSSSTPKTSKKKDEIINKENLSNEIFQDKFMVIGDNLDILIRRRHLTRDRQNVSLHLFHSIAIKNRVTIPQKLILEKAPMKNAIGISLTEILPNSDDDTHLIDEFKILVSRILVKYIEELHWMKKYVIYHIEHEYKDQMSKVSEIKTLGIQNSNETTTEGMIDILHEQHSLVPGNADSSRVMVRTFSVGDLLTVERAQNAQLDLDDSENASERLEGLIPALGDFHTYGNFLEVIWHLIYDVSSVNNVGTLHQARNFLNARSVTKQPMKDVNACEELLTKYIEALTVTAYKKLRTECSIDVEKTENDKENQAKLNALLDEFARLFLFDSNGVENKTKLDCIFCEKSFKKMRLLTDHISKSHSRADRNISRKDHIFHYSKNALSLGLMAMNFRDARKHGDGERVIRLYKYLLCYFKYDNKTKYAYQSLHLLMQIKFLLPPALSHELKWNRFANTNGKLDGNIELDRALEHRNKYAKAELNTFHGKITEKSLQRCSRTYDQVHEILENIDQQVNSKKPTGKHTVANWENDVVELSNQFVISDIFSKIEGRYHSRFPGIPESYIGCLDVQKLKTWAFEKMSEFKEMNIYSHDGIFIRKCK